MASPLDCSILALMSFKQTLMREFVMAACSLFRAEWFTCELKIRPEAMRSFDMIRRRYSSVFPMYESGSLSFAMSDCGWCARSA